MGNSQRKASATPRPNTQMSIQARERTVSDQRSGCALVRSDFPTYSDDELARHFSMFQQYDIDDSGFISPENLFEVLQAMEVKDVTMGMVHSIIDEVAVLSGHDNDGMLSFRDYMRAIQYDNQAALHNLALDAEREMRISVSEANDDEPVQIPSGESEPEPVPEATQGRARQSSMAALNTLAASRIRSFQSVANDALERERKLDAWRTKPVEAGPMVNSDEMHKETLRNKVKAFEVAAKFKGTVELKKTWRRVGGQAESGGGQYNASKKLMLGALPAKPPPRKKLTDLP